MKRSARRSAAAVVLGAAFMAVAPAAFADDYPPSTPEPTVSGVSVSATTADAAATVSDSNAALPRTGTDVAVWTIAGAALVVGGGAMVVATTRRKGVRA